MFNSGLNQRDPLAVFSAVFLIVSLILRALLRFRSMDETLKIPGKNINVIVHSL